MSRARAKRSRIGTDRGPRALETAGVEADSTDICLWEAHAIATSAHAIRTGRYRIHSLAIPLQTLRGSLALKGIPSVEGSDGRSGIVGGEDLAVGLARPGSAHRPHLAHADPVPPPSPGQIQADATGSVAAGSGQKPGRPPEPSLH